MKNLYFMKCLIIFLLFFLSVGLNAQVERTWTVTALDNPAPGYLRFDWPNPACYFLVDNYGIKQFVDTVREQPRIYYKPLSNGLWILGIPAIPVIESKYLLYDSSMHLVDSIPFPANHLFDFHDVNVLKNGNYLILCIDTVTMDLSNIVTGGKKNVQVYSNALVETDRTGHIYWEWKTLDHLNITDALFEGELTQNTVDFSHGNSVIEDSLGNLLISFANLDEITKINKANGNIIWRMGSSMSKKNEFTFINDKDSSGFVGFSHQHSISLLPNGNLLMFDNGTLKIPAYSRAVEYKIDETKKTVTKVWEYRYSPDIFQFAQGSAERLSNGNTLINWGGLKITEVKPDKTFSFELSFPSVQVYRAWRLVTRMNAVSDSIKSIGDYIYNDSNYTTGVTITVASVTGSGLTAIEKHNYAPPTGNYDGTDFSTILPYRWVFSQRGISIISGTFKINANTILNLGNPEKVIIYKRDKETIGIFRELNTSYDSVTKEISANFTGFGEFALATKVNSPKLQIVFPNGGDTLVKDTNQKIILWIQNFDGLVKIELLRNGDIVQIIKDSLSSSSGTFSWLIPPSTPTDSTYKIRITSVMDSTITTTSAKDFTIDNLTFVKEILTDNNNIWIINYPNPFSNTTTFEFFVKYAGNTSINLYSLEGEKLGVIYSKYLEPGKYSFNWDSGSISPGMFFYKIINGTQFKICKMLIVK
ncbi:MAG: aryl-sulfate sulfotransferase [FCB group bacterium]